MTGVPSQQFRQFLSRHAGLGLEKQAHLLDTHRESDWQADLERAELQLGGDRFSVEVLGSESEVSGTWMWGWANEQSDLDDRLSLTARKMATSGMPEFAEESFALDLVDGHQLATAVSGSMGRRGAYYRGPNDKGAVFLLIVDDMEAPPPSPVSAAHALRAAISLWELDHDALIEGYLDAHGLKSDPERSCVVFDGGVLRIERDASGRISELVAKRAS